MLQQTDKLYKAVENSDVDAVRETLKKGANVNVVSSCGRTALGRAAELGNLAMVCLLLDAEKFSTNPSPTLQNKRNINNPFSSYLTAVETNSENSILGKTSRLSNAYSRNLANSSIAKRSKTTHKLRCDKRTNSRKLEASIHNTCNNELFAINSQESSAKGARPKIKKSKVKRRFRKEVNDEFDSSSFDEEGAKLKIDAFLQNRRRLMYKRLDRNLGGLSLGSADIKSSHKAKNCNCDQIKCDSVSDHSYSISTKDVCFCSESIGSKHETDVSLSVCALCDKTEESPVISGTVQHSCLKCAERNENESSTNSLSNSDSKSNCSLSNVPKNEKSTKHLSVVRSVMWSLDETVLPNSNDLHLSSAINSDQGNSKAFSISQHIDNGNRKPLSMSDGSLEIFNEKKLEVKEGYQKTCNRSNIGYFVISYEDSKEKKARRSAVSSESKDSHGTFFNRNVFSKSSSGSQASSSESDDCDGRTNLKRKKILVCKKIRPQRNSDGNAEQCKVSQAANRAVCSCGSSSHVITSCVYTDSSSDSEPCEGGQEAEPLCDDCITKDENELLADIQTTEEETSSSCGGWSVAQWYNSRWATELRAQYQQVGAAWPWALSASCDPDVLDVHGSSALHYAAHAGHEHIVSVLLNAGASVDRTDGDELTALHLAARRGALSVVQTLLKKGASVNSRGADKTTALHIAASRGHTTLVVTLMDAGARLNGLDLWERTPLMLAAARGHYDTAMVLVRAGAALNIHEMHGITALCEAVWQQHEQLVRTLLEHGSTAPQSHYLLHFCVQQRNLALTRLLLDYGWPIDVRDGTGAVPLMVAARNSSPDIMRILLQRGANPNARYGVSGITTMHCAVEGTRDEQHEQFAEIFSMLLEAGARLSLSGEVYGDTPLYRAVQFQKIKAAELLIMNGASLKCGTTVLGMELLRVAVYSNNRKLALQLVLAGCPLYPCRWLDAGPFPPGSLHDTVARIRSSPLRLFDLVRIKVRELLGERLAVNAPTLPVPMVVQRALLVVGDEESCVPKY